MGPYELTRGDFSPTILYAHKSKVMQDGVYHSHDYPELTFVLSGKSRYLVEGTYYDLKAGDILMCNKGVKHQSFVIDANEPAVEFFMGVNDFHFQGMDANRIDFPEPGNIMHTSVDLREELIKCCFDMDAEWKENKSGKYFMMKSYVMRFLILIMRENAKELSDCDVNGYVFKSNNKNYIIKRIVAYLNENYNRKISLDQIAQNMYLSPVYISKIFKEEMGESPINYLIKIRLEKASLMLLESDMLSIKEIADQVGYDDVYYFSKLFKKYYGSSPLYYRKEKGVSN